MALRAGVIDRPVGLKIHKAATPLMGGVAVYLAFALVLLTVAPATKPVIGVLVGGFVATAVGLLDEFLSLRPLVHLAGQIVAALVTIVAGVGLIKSVSLPYASLASPGWTLLPIVGLILTTLWLVGMMNTVNFLDGMDGLAAGIVALAALLLATWTSLPHPYLPATAHHEDLILPLALAGALLGFLPYNWHVARIFLGDSGSMFLGLALGALAIIGPAKLGTALLVVLVPILDVAWAIVRRRLSGRSFLAGDKQHVYHRMLQLGMSHTSVVLTLYFLCIALAGLDLVLEKYAKFIAFMVLAAATFGAFLILEIRATRHDQGARQTAKEESSPVAAE